jgi:hypothetical protein
MLIIKQILKYHIHKHLKICYWFLYYATLHKLLLYQDTKTMLHDFNSALIIFLLSPTVSLSLQLGVNLLHKKMNQSFV